MRFGIFKDNATTKTDYVFVFYCRLLSKPTAAILSLSPMLSPSSLLSSHNLQSSPHRCRMGQTCAQPLQHPSWTIWSHASCPYRPRTRVGFKAKFLCCNPLTHRELHLGLPVPLFLSRKCSAMWQELQVKAHQRLMLRYGCILYWMSSLYLCLTVHSAPHRCQPTNMWHHYTLFKVAVRIEC